MSATPASISPAPSDEEAVAIAAAIHALWPTPIVVDEAQRRRDTSWKFSARWWNRPTAHRRERPFH